MAPIWLKLSLKTVRFILFSLILTFTRAILGVGWRLFPKMFKNRGFHTKRELKRKGTAFTVFLAKAIFLQFYFTTLQELTLLTKRSCSSSPRIINFIKGLKESLSRAYKLYGIIASRISAPKTFLVEEHKSFLIWGQFEYFGIKVYHTVRENYVNIYLPILNHPETWSKTIRNWITARDLKLHMISLSLG